MVEVQVNLEEVITFFRNDSDETCITEMMKISSSSAEEASMGAEMEDFDILQGGGGWPEIATNQP